MYTPPQHVLYTSDGPFGFIGSLLAEMLALVTELGMQLNSERAALMFGCLLTCFLNIVLMAAVVVAVNDAEAEMLKLRLSATLFVISLLNCWWFLTSYRRYTVQAKFGYKREPLYLWTPPTISVCLWCGLSPPHVLALGLCDTTTWSTCAGSLSLVVMITCMVW